MLVPVMDNMDKKSQSLVIVGPIVGPTWISPWSTAKVCMLAASPMTDSNISHVFIFTLLSENLRSSYDKGEYIVFHTK